MLSDLGTLTINYDPETEQIVMNSTIPIGSYAALGWGPSMINTEMVQFSADTDASQSKVATFYSSAKDTPSPDSSYLSCYTWSVKETSTGVMEFIATRPLDC